MTLLSVFGQFLQPAVVGKSSRRTHGPEDRDLRAVLRGLCFRLRRTRIDGKDLAAGAEFGDPVCTAFRQLSSNVRPRPACSSSRRRRPRRRRQCGRRRGRGRGVRRVGPSGRCGCCGGVVSNEMRTRAAADAYRRSRDGGRLPPRSSAFVIPPLWARASCLMAAVVLTAPAAAAA